MQFADQIAVNISQSNAVLLRPSLRTAFLLSERYPDFGILFRKVVEADTDALGDVFEAGAGHDARNRFKDALRAGPIGSVLENAVTGAVALIDAVLNLKPGKGSGSGKRVTFKDYHLQLYRIATGWLRWTPQDALNATAEEIQEAYAGHIEMLKAIHGSAEDRESFSDYDPQAALEYDREGLLALKGIG